MKSWNPKDEDKDEDEMSVRSTINQLGSKSGNQNTALPILL